MEKKISFLAALRDLIISYLPVKSLPPWLIIKLYGFNPDFIFLVHPRHMEDMYNVIPFLKIWRKILPESFIIKFASLWPAGVATDVIWDGKVKSLIVSIPSLPEFLFAKRENTIKAIKKIIYNYKRCIC